jgi:hypothetical protein
LSHKTVQEMKKLDIPVFPLTGCGIKRLIRHFQDIIVQ